MGKVDLPSDHVFPPILKYTDHYEGSKVFPHPLEANRHILTSFGSIGHLEAHDSLYMVKVSSNDVS
jgi:hypothetical protein